MGQEADALNEQYDHYIVETEEFASDIAQEMRQNSIIYAVNKKTKAGAAVRCPTCGRAFVKKSYQQAFCGQRGKKNKKGKATKCKDQYWNRIAFWNDEYKVQELLEKIDEMNHGESFEEYMDVD